MKTIYLIRHAKSSWKQIGLLDFQRPLKGSSILEAISKGKALKQKQVKPDLILSSTAIRALTTAVLIANELSYSAEQIKLEQRIYEADLQTLLKLIKRLPNTKDHVMLFGHNPGFSLLADYLSEKGCDELPTCGAVALTFKIDDWKKIKKGEAVLDLLIN